MKWKVSQMEEFELTNGDNTHLLNYVSNVGRDHLVTSNRNFGIEKYNEYITEGNLREN